MKSFGQGSLNIEEMIYFRTVHDFLESGVPLSNSEPAGCDPDPAPLLVGFALWFNHEAWPAVHLYWLDVSTPIAQYFPLRLKPWFTEFSWLREMRLPGLFELRASPWREGAIIAE